MRAIHSWSRPSRSQSSPAINFSGNAIEARRKYSSSTSAIARTRKNRVAAAIGRWKREFLHGNLRIPESASLSTITEESETEEGSEGALKLQTEPKRSWKNLLGYVPQLHRIIHAYVVEQAIAGEEPEQTASTVSLLKKKVKPKVKAAKSTSSTSTESKKSVKKKSKARKTTLLKLSSKKKTGTSTRYSRDEELHTYMQKRVVYADSTPSNSTVAQAAEEAMKSWWANCTCFKVQKAAVVSAEYELVPPIDTRSPHTLHYLLDVHTRLVSHPERYEGGWKNMIHYEITNAFKHTHAGLRLLHVVNSFSEKALQALSYYLEEGTKEEKIALVDGHSVIGSYMWIIADMVNNLITENHSEHLEIDTLRDALTSIVTKSSKNCEAIVRIVNQYITAAKTTLRMITRYIHVHEIDYQELIREAKQSSGLNRKTRSSIRASLHLLNDGWKARYKELKLFNNKEPPTTPKYKQTSSDSHLQLQFKSIDDPDESWTDVQAQDVDSQLDIVFGMTTAVDKTLEQVNTDLHLALKYLWQFQDSKSSSTAISYGEAMLFAKRSLKSLPYGPENRDLIHQEDRNDILELGKILQDELDLAEYFLMSLREIIMETAVAIRIPYEFILHTTGGQLPKYQIVSCTDTDKLLEMLLKEEDLRPILGDGLSKKAVVHLFNSSPYKNILKEFPLNFHRQQYSMRPSSEGHKLGPTDSTVSSTSTVTNDVDDKDKD